MHLFNLKLFACHLVINIIQPRYENVDREKNDSGFIFSKKDDLQYPRGVESLKVWKIYEISTLSACFIELLSGWGNKLKNVAKKTRRETSERIFYEEEKCWKCLTCKFLQSEITLYQGNYRDRHIQLQLFD